MTSDAKIGLLLGLVFIFIIAFVINGLPRFRSAVSNNEQANNIVDPGNNSSGIGERERRAQEIFNWQEQFASEPAQDYQSVAQDWTNTSYYTASQQNNSVNDGIGLGPAYGSEPMVEVAANNQNPDNIRYQMSLTPNASFVENTTIDEPAYHEQPTAPAGNVQPMQAGRTEPARPARPQTYTVQEGDRNLSNIAKKFYGEVEGNRLVNINRIFEANRRVLKTADEIFVGQKLLIPPLPVSTQTRDTNRGIFSNQLFENVTSIGGRRESVRWYVVKEDENLWKIAAVQLGKGSRYTEISKLNADILVDEDRVSPGMRLRLPAR